MTSCIKLPLVFCSGARVLKDGTPQSRVDLAELPAQLQTSQDTTRPSIHCCLASQLQNSLRSLGQKISQAPNGGIWTSNCNLSAAVPLFCLSMSQGQRRSFWPKARNKGNAIKGKNNCQSGSMPVISLRIFFAVLNETTPPHTHRHRHRHTPTHPRTHASTHARTHARRHARSARSARTQRPVRLAEQGSNSTWQTSAGSSFPYANPDIYRCSSNRQTKPC